MELHLEHNGNSNSEVIILSATRKILIQ